jgi:ketosteroid isomerase-like protein
MTSESTEARNRSVVERLFREVLNGGDLSLLPELYRPDVVDRNPYPGAPDGLPGVRYSITHSLGGYTESRYIIEQIEAKGDLVRVRVVFEGVPVRRIFRTAGVDKKIRTAQTIVFRLRDGRIAERQAIRERGALRSRLTRTGPFAPLATQTSRRSDT